MRAHRDGEVQPETYEGGEVFCGESEPAIFEALGLPFIEPEKRET